MWHNHTIQLDSLIPVRYNRPTVKRVGVKKLKGDENIINADKLTYTKQIGDTTYTIVVKPNSSAKKNIFELTKQMVEDGVEDMINGLAECSQKENKL